MQIKQIHTVEIEGGDDRVAQELDLARASGLPRATRSALVNEVMTEIMVYGRQMGILQFTVDGRWQTGTASDVRGEVRFTLVWRVAASTTTLL